MIKKTEQHIVTITLWFYFWLVMAQPDLKQHNTISASFVLFCKLGYQKSTQKFKTH